MPKPRPAPPNSGAVAVLVRPIELLEKLAGLFSVFSPDPKVIGVVAKHIRRLRQLEGSPSREQHVVYGFWVKPIQVVGMVGVLVCVALIARRESR